MKKNDTINYYSHFTVFNPQTVSVSLSGVSDRSFEHDIVNTIQEKKSEW